MFQPSELEGEVDHSFFDSDCDDDRVDGRVKKAGLKGEKQSSKARKLLPSKHIKDEGIDLSPKTEEMRRHFKQAEINKKNGVSDALSVSCNSDKAPSKSSDSEDDSNLRSKSSGAFLALVADALETDYDTKNTNKTGENALAASPNRKSEKSSGKLFQSQHPQSPSPTLNDASADADSESSCRSKRDISGSPSLPKTTKSSLHHGIRRTRVGSAGSRDSSAASTDESDGTVTDVSPLSSRDCSPPRSLNLNQVEKGSDDEEQQESVPSSGLSNIHQEEASYQEIYGSTISLESQLKHKLVLHCPGGRTRKNYSFSNNEVLRIDRENQRLVRELSRLSSAPRSRKAAGKKTFVANNSPLNHISHSALNRQREQRRIERENLAFLKKLESVKPTPGLRRSEQLADYQRQAGYLGAPSYPIFRSSVKKERRSRKTSSALTGPRPVISRATFTNSSGTPVPRSKNRPDPPDAQITTPNSQ